MSYYTGDGDFEAEPEEFGVLECLDGPDGCEGEVEYRMPLSGTGRSFPRCEHHWDKRLDEQDRINRLYAPDSSVPPPGFDPADIGEHWGTDY